MAEPICIYTYIIYFVLLKTELSAGLKRKRKRNNIMENFKAKLQSNSNLLCIKGKRNILSLHRYTYKVITCIINRYRYYNCAVYSWI